MPTGGWGNFFAGDPDRGFTNAQCGGWLYNILPYMEMQGLHDMGKNGDAIHGDIDKDKAAGVKQCITTAVVSYYCPSRRPPLAYYSGNCCYANLTQAGVAQPTVTGQSDYAANCGCSSDVYIWDGNPLNGAGYHAANLCCKWFLDRRR